MRRTTSNSLLTNSFHPQLNPHPPRMSPTLQHGSAQELRLCHFRDRGGSHEGGELGFFGEIELSSLEGKRRGEGAKKSTTSNNLLLCVCAYGAMAAPASRRARARSRCRSRGAARQGLLSFSLGEQSRSLARERGAERARRIGN